MHRADWICYAGNPRVQLRQFAGPLVGSQQISAFHLSQAWATLAVLPNRTFRADRQLRFANRTHSIHFLGSKPNILKCLLAKISGSDGHLYTGENVAIWRDVATVVAGTARDI